MLDQQFFYYVSSPIHALVFAAAPISIGGLVAFFVFRKKAATRWPKIMLFAAECCSIMGLVGIFTFMGRLHNEGVADRLETASSGVAESLQNTHNNLANFCFSKAETLSNKERISLRVVCSKITDSWSKFLFQGKGSAYDVAMLANDYHA